MSKFTIMKPMTESDKKYYQARANERAKRNKALSKASYRGKVAAEWFKNNKLTPETMEEFQQAMKKANKDWESNTIG